VLALSLVMLTTSVQAKVKSFNKDKDGISCMLDKGLMKVKVCFDNMVEVKYTVLPAFLDKPSLVITNDWKNTPAFSVTENDKEIVMATSKMKVAVNKSTNAV
jgi:alpha-D-xyloside xylohydrolase